MTPQKSMNRLNDLRLPIREFQFKLPVFEDPPVRTLAELQEMSDDDIQVFLDSELKIAVPRAVVGVQLALHELAMRRIDRATRSHWSVTWTFWAAIASATIGAIGIFVALLYR